MRARSVEPAELEVVQPGEHQKEDDDGGGAKEPWIAKLRETAMQQATDDERALALILLKRWVQGRHE